MINKDKTAKFNLYTLTIDIIVKKWYFMYIVNG